MSTATFRVGDLIEFKENCLSFRAGDQFTITEIDKDLLYFKQRDVIHGVYSFRVEKVEKPFQKGDIAEVINNQGVPIWRLKKGDQVQVLTDQRDVFSNENILTYTDKDGTLGSAFTRRFKKVHPPKQDPVHDMPVWLYGVLTYIAVVTTGTIINFFS